MIDLQLLLPIIVRYLGFVSLTMLVGGFGFVCLILPPGLLSREGYQILDRHLGRVQAGSILIVLLTSIVDLVLRTLAMSGGGLGTLGAALPMVLRHTHFGTVLIIRTLLLALLAAAWWLRLQGASAPSRFAWIAAIPRVGLPGITWWLRLLGTTASPQFAWISFVGACFVALTTTLSGHATGWGDVTIPVLVDWVHLIAISIWIGGLFTFGFVLKRSLAAPGMEEMVRTLSSIARLFSRIAAGCVVVFLVTGLYSSWVQVGSLSSLVASPYGWTLLVKLAVVALILMIAAVNRFYFLTRFGPTATTYSHPVFRTTRRAGGSPRAAYDTEDTHRIQYRFARFVRLEWVMVMVTLACSALLTQLMPARHMRHLEHLKSSEHHSGHLPTDTAPTAMPPSTQR
ncbi:membrane protein [Candidatus Methylomirabilis lanthanidiphila]|uniref:Membrane protein n=1 Tax=Candidatus Methylomirabilis lanthanidiphila TaxID=2211376 RepID=A0A564ZGY0_9BACT|nr:CopD family protein [Candidatus Methylomirabilis lanthanidiphila]VUZ84601.1 membrane protein [Candidatus Methylomirabilis lanthanidiphila]